MAGEELRENKDHFDGESDFAAPASASAVVKTLPDDLPPHSRGSKLSDFTKNGPLPPAEEKLRLAAMRGETCVIGDGTRPTVGTKDNTIRASFLRYLILGGCEQCPIHQRGIHLWGAFIACRPSPEFGKCFDLQAVTIWQDILLGECKIDGSVILFGASTKSLYLNGSAIESFRADSMTSNGSVHLRAGFHASGEVRLVGAKIGGTLTCSNARFDGTGISLFCDGMETKGDVFLDDGFHASGEVRLLGARIEGDLACRNGSFKSDLDADNATISGNLFLDDGFQTHGTIHLPNAKIGGNIYCNGGIFHNRDKAIHANKAVIDGNVILGAVNSAGTFSFQSAVIGGDFSANGATLSAKPSIELRGAEISGTFHWRDVKHAPGRLDLGGASAKTVNMDEKSWQKPESIKLNNFSYKSFDNLESTANSNYWKRFLEKQPEADLTEKFRPRPFEQLAEVLASMGYEEEARSIRIERQHRRTFFMANHDPDRHSLGVDGRQQLKILHWMNVLARRFMFGPLVDYGFRPGKAVLFLIALILIGTGVYWKAARLGIMTPTHPLIFKEAEGGFIPKECAENWVYFREDIASDCADAMPSEYSEFQSFIYAADIALPIVNLRMESDWAPRVVDTSGNRDWIGWWVRSFEWFLIVMGWVLSLLFVSAVGGLIRR